MEQIKKNKPRAILWVLFILALLLSLVAEQFVQHTVPAGQVAGIENQPYFYVWFSFVSCVVLIIATKFLGFFLKRRDDYYREAKNDR